MASETVAVSSDHPAPSESEGFEKEVVKKIEAENDASQPAKESVESKITEESTCEAEAKIEEKQIEGHDVAEEPKTVAEEKIEDKAVSAEDEKAAPESSAQEKVDDDKTVEEESTQEKAEDKKPVEDKAVSVEDEKAAPESSAQEKVDDDKTVEGESTQEKVEDEKPVEEVKKVEDVPVVEAPPEKAEPVPVLAEKQVEEKCAEPSEGKLEEPAKVADLPESLASEVVVENKGEETPAQVVEEATPAVEEVVEQVEKGIPECSVDKAEDAKLPKEEETSLSEAPAVAQVEEKEVVSDLIDEGNVKTEEKSTEAEKIEPKSDDVAEEKSVVAEEKPQDEKACEDEATPKDIKLEEKPVDETAKEEAKLEDVPKEGVAVKTQKQSLVKIVKQSLVKARKAIIGKSNNSKTPAAEQKDGAKA